MIKFKHLQKVCPWTRTMEMCMTNRMIYICEPLERIGSHGTFNECKPQTCPFWALEKLKQEADK